MSSGCWRCPRPRRRSTTCWRATTSTCSATSPGCWTSPTCRYAARSTTDGDVARRKKAQDFDQFEPLFKQKHAELREGTSKLLPYPGHGPHRAGRVLRPQRRHAVRRRGRRDRVQEVDGAREQARTAPVHLRERHRVLDVPPVPRDPAERRGRPDRRPDRRCPRSSRDDEVSGYIYVLRSLSDDPQIAGIKDLHKIGFSRDAVEKRIKNAEKSPTYLMAPVEVVASYRTYNLRASALENLLHRVFAEVRLDLTQIDRKGRDYDPSEWFVVPHARDRPGDRPDHLRRHRRATSTTRRLRSSSSVADRSGTRRGPPAEDPARQESLRERCRVPAAL